MARTDLPKETAVAALPYRLGRHGLEILLVTSRESRGWGIPMGLPSEERHPHRTAEIEAFHAAGVKGAISRKPIGAYAMAPRPEDAETLPGLCDVYPLLVSNEAATWPGKNQRRRVWFPGHEAAEKVEAAALGQLIRDWLEVRMTSGRGMAKQARGRGGSRHG